VISYFSDVDNIVKPYIECDNKIYEGFKTKIEKGTSRLFIIKVDGTDFDNTKTCDIVFNKVDDMTDTKGHFEDKPMRTNEILAKQKIMITPIGKEVVWSGNKNEIVVQTDYMPVVKAKIGKDKSTSPNGYDNDTSVPIIPIDFTKRSGMNVKYKSDKDIKLSPSLICENGLAITFRDIEMITGNVTSFYFTIGRYSFNSTFVDCKVYMKNYFEIVATKEIRLNNINYDPTYYDRWIENQ
jgi:hypothetical protein